MAHRFKRAVLAVALATAALPLRAAEPVSIDNFIRAETDFHMKTAVGMGCFARLCHTRGPVPVSEQTVIVRLYRPRTEILDGSWKFPAATPAG